MATVPVRTTPWDTGAAPVVTDPATLARRQLDQARLSYAQLLQRAQMAEDPREAMRLKQAAIAYAQKVDVMARDFGAQYGAALFPEMEQVATIPEVLAQGGSTTSGGGGSSSYAAQQAAQQAAMKAGYEQMLAALDKQGTAQAGIFDQRNTQLGSLRAAGDQRLQGILAELQGSAQNTRGQVAGAFQGADSQLQSQMADFAAMEQARQQGAGRTMEAFGASPQLSQRGMSPLDVIAAQRATLGSQAGTADAMYANRSNVYNGLNSDVSTRNSQSYDALMARLAQERAAWQAQQEAERAKIQIAAGQQGVTL